MITDVMARAMAKEIKRVDANKPEKSYMCHGEPHFYKQRITEDEIADIIIKMSGCEQKADDTE